MRIKCKLITIWRRDQEVINLAWNHTHNEAWQGLAIFCFKIEGAKDVYLGPFITPLAFVVREEAL